MNSPENNTIEYRFQAPELHDFMGNIRREWALTNGIGGYAGSSILGAHNRTHQGYLIASLHPPVERYLVFSKINEQILQDGKCYDLTTAQHKDIGIQDGNRYLTEFLYDGTIRFTYQAGAITMHKSLTLVHGQNTAAIAYEIINDGTAAELILTPLMNYREHSTNSTPESLQFTSIDSLNYTGDAESTDSSFYTGDSESTDSLHYTEETESTDSLLFARDTESADSLSDTENPESGSAVWFTLTPKANPAITIALSCSEGTLLPREELYDMNMLLQTEVDNETDGLDCHYTPYDIKVELPAHATSRISVICTIEDFSTLRGDCNYVSQDADHQHNYDSPFHINTSLDTDAKGNTTCETGLRHPSVNSGTASTLADSELAFRLVEAEKARIRAEIAHAGYTDRFANMLVLATGQFLTLRQSTGLTTVLAGLPWFTDWGRDTMIAFTGLTLATGRKQEAREILKTFAQYVHHGLVPNMFPDDGMDPLYNTADASLWYFYAVHEYLQYNNLPEDYAFIRTEIFPKLLEIADAYQKGTDFSISMDEDGLIRAGSDLDQITWMDVRVGDWVATPRHGKPVEINALWYNALRILAQLCRHYADSGNTKAESFELLADKVKESFAREFWNESDGYLYDVVGCSESSSESKDDSLRPNQIFAVSLPFSLLSPEQEAAVVDTVQRELFAGTGLRSLAPGHPDYHPIYLGSLDKRDHAYHQGTSWGFLLGGFYTAFMKVHGHTHEAAQTAREMLEPVVTHMCSEGCIGSISEIFDGDAPHHSRGCYAQAWSVGEMLRCYTQDILPYL